MRFSKRHGYKGVREQVQIESLDEKTRTRLWNVFYEHIVDLNRNGYMRPVYGEYSSELWVDHLHRRKDEMPDYGGDMVGFHKRLINKGKWFEVMDFLEFTSKYFSSDRLDANFNKVLEEEKSAYRIIEGEVVPISDEVELESIEEGLKRTTMYEGVREHLQTALAHFSDEDDPDYRNSVKESISAAESMAQRVIGDEDATLGQALSRMEQERGLNGALKSSFSSLYGYASDQEGIRHALSEKSDVSFAFAKFMLVNCTAFVNYLIDEYEAE
jgi:hypothetical protein